MHPKAEVCKGVSSIWLDNQIWVLESVSLVAGVVPKGTFFFFFSNRVVPKGIFFGPFFPIKRTKKIGSREKKVPFGTTPGFPRLCWPWTKKTKKKKIIDEDF